MKDYGWLRPDDLQIDSEVQRAFDKAHATRIAKVYDPLLFGIGHVSLRRDGRFYVLDAQHRVMAARMAGKGDIPVLFKVHKGLDTAEEAELFRALNANKKNVNALDDFRLAVKAGSQAHSDVNGIVESFGLRIAANKTGGGVSAVVALLNIYQGKVGVTVKHNAPATDGLPRGHLLSRTLHILTSTWPNDKNACDALLLRGVAALLHTYGTQVDADHLIRNLTKCGTALQVIGQINGLSSVSPKSPVACALDWMRDLFNRRRGRGSRLE